MKDSIEYITNRVKDIIEVAGLRDVITNEITFSDWEDITRYETNTDDYWWNAGCTRAVFWDGYQDYVIKIDLDDDARTEDEYYVYTKALENDVADAFAEIIKIPVQFEEDDNTYYVYVMEYCDVDEDYMSSQSYAYSFAQACDDLDYDKDSLTDEQSDEVNDYVWDNYDSSDGMLDFAFDEWGNLFFKAFSEFMWKMHLNDLHSGNWGFRFNTTTKTRDLVIVDYAGFGCGIKRLSEKERVDD